MSWTIVAFNGTTHTFFCGIHEAIELFLKENNLHQMDIRSVTMD